MTVYFDFGLGGKNEKKIFNSLDDALNAFKSGSFEHNGATLPLNQTMRHELLDQAAKQHLWWVQKPSWAFRTTESYYQHLHQQLAERNVKLGAKGQYFEGRLQALEDQGEKYFAQGVNSIEHQGPGIGKQMADGIKGFGTGAKSHLFDRPSAALQESMHGGIKLAAIGGAAAIGVALLAGMFGGKKKSETDGYADQNPIALDASPQTLPDPRVMMTEPPQPSASLAQDGMPGSQVDISQIMGNKGMQPAMGMA